MKRGLAGLLLSIFMFQGIAFAGGDVFQGHAEFDKEYTGVMITIEPGEGFTPSGEKKSVFSYAKDRLKGTGTAVAFVVLTTTI